MTTATPDQKIAALLAVADGFSVSQTVGRVWLEIDGARVVGVEAGSAAAEKLLNLDAARQDAIETAQT